MFAKTVAKARRLFGDGEAQRFHCKGNLQTVYRAELETICLALAAVRIVSQLARLKDSDNNLKGGNPLGKEGELSARVLEQ
eukprot:2981753-Amphidinium_carterae.1